MPSLDTSATLPLVAAFSFCSLAFASLLWNGGAFSPLRRGDCLSGHWGPIASSVDWCEENYVAEPRWVAEPHNSWTSLLFVLFGVIGLANVFSCRGVEMRFVLLNLTFITIGIGSTAFHMTLQREMQAADEVPMVWMGIVASFVMLHQPHTHPTGWLQPAFLLALAVFATVINFVTIGAMAVWAFYLTFVPVELYSWFSAVGVYTSAKDPATRQVFKRSFAQYAVALTAWAFDSVGCGALQSLPLGVPNPQLHAYGWHVFSAIATHGACVAVHRERLAVLGRKARMTSVFGIPWVVVDDDEPHKYRRVC